MRTPIADYRASQTRIASLNEKIANLREVEICVGNNEGTFGAAECGRKMGSGDPKCGNYTVWVTISGVERCDNETARLAGVGRFRRNANSAAQLRDAREALTALKKELSLAQADSMR